MNIFLGCVFKIWEPQNYPYIWGHKLLGVTKEFHHSCGVFQSSPLRNTATLVAQTYTNLMHHLPATIFAVVGGPLALRAATICKYLVEFDNFWAVKWLCNAFRDAPPLRARTACSFTAKLHVRSYSQLTFSNYFIKYIFCDEITNLFLSELSVPSRLRWLDCRSPAFRPGTKYLPQWLDDSSTVKWLQPFRDTPSLRDHTHLGVTREFDNFSWWKGEKVNLKPTSWGVAESLTIFRGWGECNLKPTSWARTSWNYIITT